MKKINKSETGISVIIPTFNRAKFLYSTLLCLCNQKISINLDYEIIIIDSGDDNETELIVNDLKDRGNLFISYKKVKNSKNRSYVRNLGATKAKYDILCFLDNDILVPTNFISTIYEEQINKENQVLLYLRRFLTNFSLEEFGENTLINNFELLETLPWYSDERDNKDLSNNSWRYAFSHTFIVSKTSFNKAHGFNNSFGEQWGLEDIELAYRLYIQNNSFKFSNQLLVYHQPHFNQSTNEQQKVEPNQRLFLQLHNTFESEIEICFCNFFNEYYDELNNIRINCKTKVKNDYKYDLILGILNSVEEHKNLNNKYRLGIVCPYGEQSKKNVLITSNIYNFSSVIQRSILSESFRISKNLFIEKENDNSKTRLTQLFNDVGLIVELTEENNLYRVQKKGNSKKGVMAIQLPDILQPEKRFFYLWIAKKLYENNYQVYLDDIKRINTLKDEDYGIDYNTANLLNLFIERSYACTPFKHILSFDTVYVYKLAFLEHTKCDYYFMDNGYPMKPNISLLKAFGKGLKIEKDCYQLLLFTAVNEYLKNYQPLMKQINKNKICCFMENGYLEDGMDIILEAFSEISKQDDKAKLSIKVPEYEKLLMKCYPRHNEASRYYKQVHTIHKITEDFNKLGKKIADLKLNGKVEIIQKNYLFTEIIDFINSNGTLLHASRGSSLPPQVYLAIQLCKKVCLAESYRIIPPLKEYCNETDSRFLDFALEFNVPKSCENLLFSAIRIDKDDLIEAYLKKEHEIITNEDIDIVNSMTNSLIEKILKY